MEDSSSPPGPERRRLHVVMVIQRFRPYFSGQGVQLEELSRVLVRRGADVTVVAAMRGRDAPREERIHGVSIRRLRSDLPGRGDSRLRRRLWSPTFAARTFLHLLLRAGPVDLVHVHGATDALYAAWAFGRLRRVPVLFEMTLMGVDDPLSMQSSKHCFAGTRDAIYRRFPGYVAMSPALAQAYREAGMPEDRLRMIPQGVDVERYRPAADRAVLRRELSVAEDEPVLVFLGSLVERKGIDVLLAAWERIHRERPAARLWLVGRDRFADDPAAESFLERCLGTLSPAARARVERFGVRGDAERFLQAADAFLFPSRREGFGTAIIEAMACGVPCVASNVGGSRAILSGDDAGLLFEAGDAAGLAARLEQVLTQPETARRLGERGRAAVVAHYDLERLVAGEIALLRRVAGVA